MLRRSPRLIEGGPPKGEEVIGAKEKSSFNIGLSYGTRKERENQRRGKKSFRRARPPKISKVGLGNDEVQLSQEMSEGRMVQVNRRAGKKRGEKGARIKEKNLFYVRKGSGFRNSCLRWQEG